MIQTPLTVWSWWLADFPNVVRTSFPSAFSPSPAPAKQHNNVPSCPFLLLPIPIPALPHSLQDYLLRNSPLRLSLNLVGTSIYPLFCSSPSMHRCTGSTTAFHFIAQVCGVALEIPSLTITWASGFLFLPRPTPLLFTCCLWFMILQSIFCSEAECCSCNCCLPWFPALYWDTIAISLNSGLHPLPSSPYILGVRPF